MASTALEEQEQLAVAKTSQDFAKMASFVASSKIRIEALKVVEELTRDGANASEFLSAELCEGLVAILQQPGTDAATSVIWVCDVVANLAVDEACREKFSQLGLCQHLVPAISACNKREEQLAESGLFAISKLGFNHDLNIAQLGEHGACEFLVQQASKFGKDNAAVAGNACSAIICLARDGTNRKLLLELGAASQVVMPAIELYGTESDQIAYLGFSAMANLAVGLDGEVSVLPNCQVLVNCLKATTNLDVIEKACIALANIGLNDVNRAQLGATLCQVAVDQWKQLGEMSERLAAAELMLVANLAFNNPPNQTRLGKAGAIFQVVAELKDFGVDSEVVAKNGCLAVGNLAARNGDNLLYMAGMNGLCDVLVDCLRVFGPTSASIANK
ncbi:hypothetical protein BASA81_015742 [Batrachochytrium salamandrivorans]|nr:hypothetical protein BASA81_015742 [Batrachochytrium salamandrivorans]